MPRSVNVNNDLPPVQFTTKEDVSKKHKIFQVAWNIFSTLIFPIGLARLGVYGINKLVARKCVLLALGKKENPDNVENCNKLRNRFMQANSTNNSKAEQVTICTADGINLDAMTIRHNNSKKWIIYFNGQNGNYENGLESYKEISKDTKANLLVFNYRGVMRSQGTLTSSHDLVLDGEAMVQYLLKTEHIDASDILLHGHSLGGGIAAEVAAQHPSMHLCSDRSFSTLYEGSLSILVYKLKKISGKTAKTLRPIVRLFARAMGWRFHSIENLKKITGHKIIIYAKKDDVIGYDIASLHQAAMQANVQMKSIELTQKNDDQDWHNVSLRKTTSFAEYVKAVKEALHIP